MFRSVTSKTFKCVLSDHLQEAVVHFAITLMLPAMAEQCVSEMNRDYIFVFGLPLLSL